MNCPLCQSPLTKVGSLVSGNSRFVTLRCVTCGREETVCLGVLE